RAVWGPRTGSRRPSQDGSFDESLVLVLADRIGPDDRAVRQPGLGHRVLKLLRRLLDGLVPAVGVDHEPGSVQVASDARGDAVVAGDRIRELDHFLAGQDPVTFGLNANAPSHEFIISWLRHNWRRPPGCSDSDALSDRTGRRR